MDVAEFRQKVTELASRVPLSTDDVTDDEFWNQISDWSLEVLAAKSKARREKAKAEGKFPYNATA